MRIPRPYVRLALEEAGQIADGMGGFRLEWRHLGWLWAELQAGAGRERDGGVGPESVVRWRIMLRAARPGDRRRPVPGQRFRHEARVFRIEAVAEHDPAGRWQICHATEEFQA